MKDNQKEKLKQMLIAEREKVQGYEQLGRIHNAYIGILLKRLNATQENPIVISAEEVMKALDGIDVRATKQEGQNVWEMYVEELKE